MTRSSGSSPPLTSDGSATAAYAVSCARPVLAKPAQRSAKYLGHVSGVHEFRRISHGFVDAAVGVLL
ncbi:hypothetical protein D3C72_2467310 [compost metagenome]